MREARSALHLIDYRVKRAVGVLRRTEVSQACMRFVSDAFQQRRSQSRFADPGFAGKQYHLAFASLGFRPAAQEQLKFFLSPHKLCQPAAMERLKPTFNC